MKSILVIILLSAMHTCFASAVPANFSAEYNNPEPSINYYRLKILFNESTVEYSSPIPINFGNAVYTWKMFPVPVRDVLNFQYTGIEPIQGVVSIFISNMSGYVITRKRYSSLSRMIQVPVDNLGRGTYNVRIVINKETVYDQRFVK